MATKARTLVLRWRSVEIHAGTAPYIYRVGATLAKAASEIDIRQLPADLVQRHGLLSDPPATDAVRAALRAAIDAGFITAAGKA